MKATGIVRKLDKLGRIVIPRELRTTLDLFCEDDDRDKRDSIEIFTDGDYIVLKKYAPACIFCGNAKDVTSIHGKNICSNCIEELKKL